jgi:hypothetical protein
MDLRKEIQVALNNCQPNTNRVDKIEAIAQKYAELEQALQLQQTRVISWVFANYKLPTVEENGKKVLLYRIMNDSQESQSVSIHETSMVKYCNKEETWWMEIPPLPCL